MIRLNKQNKASTAPVVNAIGVTSATCAAGWLLTVALLLLLRVPWERFWWFITYLFGALAISWIVTLVLIYRKRNLLEQRQLSRSNKPNRLVGIS